MLDIGSGAPLVLVPGIQGRWEYQQSSIDALAATFRVVTFPLCGEPGSEAAFDPALGLDNYAHQILAALNRSGIERATVCGISFGGLPAIRFAATHPERTSALVLASTPGPNWRLSSRHRLYARFPWIFGLLFLAETPFRLRAELACTFPKPRDRWRFALSRLGTFLHTPVSPGRMAARAALIPGGSLVEDCRRLTVPTLVITGEPDLDRIVPVHSTMAYGDLIASVRHRTLHGTGHLGSVTTPEAFAEIVQAFVEDSIRRARESTPEREGLQREGTALSRENVGVGPHVIKR